MRYLRWIVASVLAVWVLATVFIGWYKIAEEKQNHLAHLLARNIVTHVDSIDVQWGTTSGHPEVMIYGFPSPDKQAIIIDRIRRLKQDLQIIQPVPVTFRAYPMKVMKPNGEEANGKYAPDEVIRSITL